ncbi:N-formylglutamate amidohydrolase [Roseibium sp.]|uniref:N-formylglutamate amidohydrolase n=1 Tax=Roseibium sp. TaxID=1936156 RepID=UPI003BA89193
MLKEAAYSAENMGKTLLAGTDPEPVDCIRGPEGADIVLVCEHAGRAIPQRLGTLGLTSEDLDRHIAWDIGALAVSERIAANLGADLVKQRYSRLVYDCNRPFEAPDATPEVSEDSVIPGNQNLSDEERLIRKRMIFDPYDAALTAILDERPKRAAFAIHSFTPVYLGKHRPWHLGLLSRTDPETADIIAATMQRRDNRMLVGKNVPYMIEEDSDWFIPRHAEPRGLAHCLVEIRNDLIDTEQGQDLWAGHLTAAFKDVLEKRK